MALKNNFFNQFFEKWKIEGRNFLSKKNCFDRKCFRFFHPGFGAGLYNGNISHTTIALSKINNGALAGYTYKYDQLNRLMSMQFHAIGTNGTWSNTLGVGNAYNESYNYDANGNIATLNRNGSSAQPAMDNLKYWYYYKNKDGLDKYYDAAPTALKPVDADKFSNKLAYVEDPVAATNYTEDIDGQTAGNYVYDKIGNLIIDDKENITGITWTVYGKIASIAKRDGSTLQYNYDAGGNRISKVYTTGGVATTTYYVRDAQGNTLGLYEGAVRKEQYLFGSSRLGVWKLGVNSGNPSREYELSNHLGNVMATIGDKKTFNESYNEADVVTMNEYYPGGMLMPGRKYNSGNSSYRYGFNGQERSTELGDDSYTAEFWQYDSRLSRRWNVEPMADKLPALSPYSVFGNNPIRYTDPDGAFLLDVHQRIAKNALMNFTFELIKRNRKSETSDQALDNDIKNQSFMFGIVGQGTIFSGGITDPDWNQSKIKAAHFDEMNYTQIISNAESIKSKITTLVKNYKNGGLTEKAFGYEVGKQLHAIADLYSHSNYVELYIQIYGKEGDINATPTLNEALTDSKYEKFATLLKTDLKTGKYPGKGKGSHKEMNHDVGAGSNYTGIVPETRGKKVTYQTKAAEAVATKASKEYLEGIKTEAQKTP